MQLYIIRHAQSYNNALQDQSQRLDDPHLTELGLKQADLVADFLANGVNIHAMARTVEETKAETVHGFGITKLYCSGMYRALQTAQPIGKALGLDPEVWLDVHEFGGIFKHDEDGNDIGSKGKTRSQMQAEFPGYVLPDEVTEEGWWTGGREDWSLCHGRAVKSAARVRKWAEELPDERIAFVTHGGFIDAFIKAVFYQLPTPHLFYHHYNTSVTRLDFNAEKEFVNVWYLNRVVHLPPELVS